MRIEMDMICDQLPLHYRMGTLSFIKEAVKKSDPHYFNKIFVNNQDIKPFTYSVYLKGFELGEHDIQLKGFRLTISSSDLEFMLLMYNGANQVKHFSYKDYSWVCEGIRLIPEKTLTCNRAVFRTLSPILIEDKAGNSIEPTRENYEKEFNYYADLIVKAFLGRNLKQALKVKPIRMSKVVIKESNSEFINRFGKEQHLFFTAYKGYLSIEGHCEDLTCLYQNGISKRRSLGFGLLDVELEGGRYNGGLY